MKLAEYDVGGRYKAGKMNVNVDALPINPIYDNIEKSKHLQVDDKDTFMTSQEKVTTNKIFTRNKQENSKNKEKPLKRRYLNPVILPDGVDHFSEIWEAHILNIDSKLPEFFQDFLSEESFSEIGKDIFKYKLYSKFWLRDSFLGQYFFQPSFYQKIRKFMKGNHILRKFVR